MAVRYSQGWPTVMVFFTLCCVVLLNACDRTPAAVPDSADQGAIKLVQPRLERRDEAVLIHSGFDLQLSNAAEQALHQGIPLSLKVVTRIARYRRFWAWLIEERRWQWRISYLPLSRQYVLEQPDGERLNFSRLRHLRAALRNSRSFALQRPAISGDNVHYQLQIRGFIDTQSLPSPLRLPALFSPQWRLNSGWHTWLMESV